MDNQAQNQTKEMNVWGIRVYALIIIGFVIYASVTASWESSTPQFVIVFMAFLTLIETLRPLLKENRKLAQLVIAVLVGLFVSGVIAFYFLR